LEGLPILIPEVEIVPLVAGPAVLILHAMRISAVLSTIVIAPLRALGCCNSNRRNQKGHHRQTDQSISN
jgi:hypothetical protein